MSSFDLSVKDYAIAAGVPLLLHRPATFFQLMDASGSVDIEVLNSESVFGKAEGVTEGFSFGGPDESLFHAVKITSATSQTLKLCFARGSVDLRQVVGNVALTNTGGAIASSRATVLTSGVSTLAAANAARRVVMLQNTSAADFVRFTLDGSAPTASQGMRLAPGAFWESPPMFAPTGAVKAIAETGAGAAVEVMEG